MPDLVITIPLTANQATKVREAAEFASRDDKSVVDSPTFTLAEAATFWKGVCIRALRHDVKSYLRDRRNLAGAVADEEDIDALED